MEDYTRKFNAAKEKDEEIHHILTSVYTALEEKGYSFESAEIEMVPQNYIVMTSEDDVRSMTKLLDTLEDNEDVQNVWHNWEDAE